MNESTKIARPTIDQRRAKHAWDAVEEARNEFKNTDNWNEYVVLAKKLPIQIMTSGIGQVLAFVLAKDKKSGNKLIINISDWVLKAKQESTGSVPGKFDLVEKLIGPNANSDLTRIYTEEIICYLQWLNRFASAVNGN